MADLGAAYRSYLEPLLEGGEELRGVCAASQQKGLFSGGSVALGVTDRRLIVQPLDRHGKPGAEAILIRPDDVAAAKAGGAGGGWFTATAGIMDHAAVRLEIETISGKKLKLMLMRGEGRLLGKLGGGDAERLGVEALAAWFQGIQGP